MKTALVIVGCDDIVYNIRLLLNFLEKSKVSQANCDVIILTDSADRIEFKKINCAKVFVFLSEQLSMENYNAETALFVLSGIFQKYLYDLVLCAGSFTGNELATRLGFRMHSSWITNAEEITVLRNGLSVKRSVYNQNLKAKYLLRNKPYFLGTAKTIDEPKEYGAANNEARLSPQIIFESIEIPKMNWISDGSIQREEKENALSDARHVVVAGRGVREKDDIQILYQLAHALGGRLGGTRAIVADGKLPLDVIVGSSGKILHADICITFGVSGAMPLMEGVKKCKLIISVNTDSRAPIFKGSDVGICEKWKPIATKLIELLSNNNMIGSVPK